jgi:molecular chaperone DnaK (HSP70)
MSDNANSPVLGIDLGTTFSAITWWNERRQQAVHYQTRMGDDSLQSAVYYDPDKKEFLVGQLAYNRGMVFPENLALGVKRQMDDAAQHITIGGKAFSPIDLSSKILERLYGDVVNKFPPGIFTSRGTVVTVPYYFKAHQCENTRKAADLARINCIGLIQEPIAASLAYAWELVQNRGEQETSETILVFDLGGGTFDLTLFRLEQTQTILWFEVLATGGDDRLGGMDFDECLLRLLLEKGSISLDGLSALDERKARQKILREVTTTKETLSFVPDTDFSVPDVIPGQHIDTKITRAEFESSIQRYVDKIETAIDRLWGTANLPAAKVDRVILVGGSSRIPRVKALVGDLIGRGKVYEYPRPDLCIAEGAAMYAAYLDDPDIFGREIQITTRTSHALGVEIYGGEFFTLIPANRKTPYEYRQSFTTHTDNQTTLDINVYQGSARLVKDNTRIGTIHIPDLPPRKADELNIEVTFKVSEEQMLSVIVEVEGRRWSNSLNFN